MSLPRARQPSENQERTLPLTTHFQVSYECPMEGPAAQAGPRQPQGELTPAESYIPHPEWNEGGKQVGHGVPGAPTGDPIQMSRGGHSFGQRVPLYSTAPASRVFLLRSGCQYCWCQPMLGGTRMGRAGKRWGELSLTREATTTKLKFHDFNPWQG